MSRPSRVQRHLVVFGSSLRRTTVARNAAEQERISSDYVVMGAGIIGLSCARALLQSSPDASVTVLERAEPSLQAPGGAGTDTRLHLQNTTTATGAGQGYVSTTQVPCPHRPCRTLALPSQCQQCRYIWMGHRDPKNEAIWKLAARGVALWKAEAAELSR